MSDKRYQQYNSSDMPLPYSDMSNSSPQPPSNYPVHVVGGRTQLLMMPSAPCKNTTEILKNSQQLINLHYDHLKDDQNHQNMKKLGLLSGSKQAIDNGVTTITETLLGGGTMTNPNIRLSEKE